MGTDGSSFVLRCKEGTFEVTTNLVALYNIYNLLAAVAAMCESGIKVEDMLPYLETLKQIEGRLERIDEGQPFNVFVDFAHTPDGMEKVFEYAKGITPDNCSIIAVLALLENVIRKSEKYLAKLLIAIVTALF